MGWAPAKGRRRTIQAAWEDEDLVAAVVATGRKKLIIAALRTEVCLVFPALDAMQTGFEVYAVVDAVAGISEDAHRTGLGRIMQAGAKPVSLVQLACELLRDWNREETAARFAGIGFTEVGEFRK